MSKYRCFYGGGGEGYKLVPHHTNLLNSMTLQALSSQIPFKIRNLTDFKAFFLDMLKEFHLLVPVKIWKTTKHLLGRFVWQSHIFTSVINFWKHLFSRLHDREKQQALGASLRPVTYFCISKFWNLTQTAKNQVSYY